MNSDLLLWMKKKYLGCFKIKEIMKYVENYTLNSFTGYTFDLKLFG
jgi:hypothetical protein